jgi:hypothetical protein
VGRTTFWKTRSNSSGLSSVSAPRAASMKRLDCSGSSGGFGLRGMLKARWSVCPTMQGYRQAPNSVIASISKPMPNTTPKANPHPHATGSSPASRRKKEIMRLMYGPPESMRVRCGLWLARVALRITGNHELANVARVLPLIPQRRLAISPEKLDRQSSGLLSGTEWLIWDPSGASGHPLSDRSS